MSDNLLTVKEIADMIGVSKQAVHKKIKQEPLSTGLRSLMTTVDGTVYIDVDGLTLIKSAFVKDLPSTVDDNLTATTVNQIADTVNQLIASLQSQIEFLRKQIEVKDDLLKNKDDKIDELTIKITDLTERLAVLFENSQQLQQNQQLLEAQFLKPPAETETPDKKGFFKRIFQRHP